MIARLRADAVRIPLADGSVHCVITSPPYFGLRAYAGVPATAWGGEPAHAHEWGPLERGKKNDRKPAEGGFATNDALDAVAFAQGAAPLDGGHLCVCGAWLGTMGNEPSVELYVRNLVAVFREIRRVLRHDGVAWLNLGDSFGQRWASVRSEGGRAGMAGDDVRTRRARGESDAQDGQLLGVPWRVAFALQDDGWVLRNDVTFCKRAPMPESISGTYWRRHRVKVRSADVKRDGLNGSGRRSHGATIDEPQRVGAWPDRPHQAHDGHEFAPRAEWRNCLGCESCEPNSIPCEACEHTGVDRVALRAAHQANLATTDAEHRVWATTNPCPNCDGRGKIGLVLRRGSWRHTRAAEQVFMLAKSMHYFADGEAVREPAIHGNGHRTVLDNVAPPPPGDPPHRGLRLAPGPEAGRNPRSFLLLGPEPLRAQHYAAMPSRLVEPLLLASTSAKGACRACGAQWAPVVERSPMVVAASARGRAQRNGETGNANGGTMVEPPRSRVVAWRPTCACGAPAVPSVVLDPFAGSGTVGRVAIKHRRRAVLCDLSMTYLRDIADSRTRDIQLELPR